MRHALEKVSRGIRDWSSFEAKAFQLIPTKSYPRPAFEERDHEIYHDATRFRSGTADSGGRDARRFRRQQQTDRLPRGFEQRSVPRALKRIRRGTMASPSRRSVCHCMDVAVDDHFIPRWSHLRDCASSTAIRVRRIQPRPQFHCKANGLFGLSPGKDRCCSCCYSPGSLIDVTRRTMATHR